jgi:hypothetical protein
MRLFFMIMLLSAPILANRVALSADAPPAISRVTTSFDLRYTGAVLNRVSRLLSAGFKAQQVDTLLKEIDAMKAETPQAWTFNVVHKGKVRELQVRALVDDLGMIDLDFATDSELAAEIRIAVDSYLNRRN